MIFLVTNFCQKNNSAQILKMEFYLKIPFLKKITKCLKLGFSFLSLCHPKLIFFHCPFLALIIVFFCWNFIFSLPPTHFYFYFAFETFSAYPPSNLPTYSPILFKLKVDSSPSTYSPINLKMC